MGQSPQPRETPNLVLVYARQTDDCCGIGFPDSFPYQLQGRIDPDLWKKIIYDVNDAVAQTSSEVCCIVVSAFCIFCGGMCWIITQPGRKRRKRIAVLEKYNNEIFRPRGMLLTYQLGHHNQGENVQRCYLQIDILPQVTTTVTTTSIIPTSTPVINCPQCQLAMGITPGFTQFQCPRCKHIFSIGSPPVGIPISGLSSPPPPTSGGYGPPSLTYPGEGYTPPYEPPPYYPQPLSSPSSPSAPPTPGEVPTTTDPDQPGSGPYTQSMY